VDVDPDLQPVIDLLELTLNGHTDDPHARAVELVDVIVAAPGAAYALAIAHADWRAQQG
jgi:hypothetical protein